MSTLAELLADTGLHTIQAAIVAGLRAQLPADVAVVGHPGKLDIGDLVAKEVVSVPGVAVGWSRARAIQETPSSYALAIEWAAYIVAEDKVIGNRRVGRDAIGIALSCEVLRLLNDDAIARWGVPDLSPPEPEPVPEAKPVMTVKVYEKGTALYAVTWRQTLHNQGQPFMGMDGEPPPNLAFYVPLTPGSDEEVKL